MHFLLALFGLSGAFAQEAPTETIELDQYVFAIEACDRIRAEAATQHEEGTAPTPQLVLTVKNASETPCEYTGISLQGFLDGKYVTSRGNSGSEVLTLEPGKEISFRINPKQPKAPRGKVQLQIAPGADYMLFIGQAPPAPEPAPEEAVEAQPAESK